MNVLSAVAHWSPKGWIAFYTPYHTTRPKPVTDAKGEPIRYPTEEKAKLAAFEALLAELNRVEAIRFEPDQVQPTPKFYELRRVAAKRSRVERMLMDAMNGVAS